MQKKPRHHNTPTKTSLRTNSSPSKNGARSNPSTLTYFSMFPAGLGEIVERCLSSDLERFECIYRDDSGILYSASVHSKINLLPYLKNTFEILYQVQQQTPSNDLKTILGRMRSQPLPPRFAGRANAFRLMAHENGQLTPLPAAAKRALESYIEDSTGARVNRRGGSGAELWLINRRSLSLTLFGMRLPARARGTQRAGSLSSELAHLLVKLSRPNKLDRFLDPFAGSASIPIARAEYPVRVIIANDSNPSFACQPGHSRIVRISEDALEFGSVASGSIDVIVTDPPWGEFEEQTDSMDVKSFLSGMAESFNRILDKRHGRVVVLINRRGAEVTRHSMGQAGFNETDEYDILVNGHPATVMLYKPVKSRHVDLGK